MKNEKNKAALLGIYCTAFFFALYASLPLYVNSSLLGRFLPESLIGFVYTIASLFLLFILPQFPKVLALWGNYSVALFVFGGSAFAFLGLAFIPSGFFALLFFIASQIFLSLGFFNLDVFVEAFGTDSRTGTIRSYMLTVLNSAIFLGPLLAGIMVTDGDFFRVYLIAPLFLIPAVFLLRRSLATFKEPAYRAITFWKTLKNVLWAPHPRDPLRHALISDFLLRFFYTWMVIYMPIYLYKYVGFDWHDISISIALALLPFVLFEIPVGKLLDRLLQEKHVMALGFAITAFFTITLFFVESSSLFVWTVLLFGTRVGASLIEVSSESYFFKHIHREDTTMLSLFRNTQPLAYIIAPGIASVILIALPFHYLFIVLGFFLFLGAWNSSLIPSSSRS